MNLNPSTTQSRESPVKYPDVEVRFSGEDGNAFNLVGLALRALRSAGVDKAERDVFVAEATSGDYDHLLRTCMEWVNVR